MKKLSEIGKEVPSTEEFACMNAAAENNFIVFTPGERRELVRNSIKKFILGYVESYLLKDALGICIDKFCEEQGI